MPKQKTMSKTPARAARQLSKTGGETGSAPGMAGKAVANANKWREQYNYLRGLMMARAVALLEAGLMGDYPELQRVYALAEASNGTYVGLVERCLAPFAEFDWEIKTVEEKKLPPGATKEMAEKQAATLRTKYDLLDNLQEAIEHFALADFRGYSHVQKQRISGLFDADGNLNPGKERYARLADLSPDEIFHLECLPQWKFSRDGLFGDWYWNPSMFSTQAAPASLGEANRIGGEMLPRNDFIIREVRVPIDRVGLQFFIYTKLAEKNYAGFMEIYGIPSGVVTMPANIPKDQADEYAAAARLVAEGGSGAIPNGSTYTTNDAPRSQDPFTPFLKYWQEQLILAGTSGKLTMLAESGSGTLAGGAHEDTFKIVAAARAKKISECFQKDFDADVLASAHPGEPVLAYFELCSQDEVDVTALCTNVQTLKNAGITVDQEWLEEKTGYQFEEAEELDLTAKNAEAAKLEKLANRDDTQPAADGQQLKFAAAIAADLKPYLAAVAERADRIAAITDPVLRAEKTKAMWAELQSLEADILADPASAAMLAQLAAQGFKDGITDKTPIAK